MPPEDVQPRRPGQDVRGLDLRRAVVVLVLLVPRHDQHPLRRAERRVRVRENEGRESVRAGGGARREGVKEGV